MSRACTWLGPARRLAVLGALVAGLALPSVAAAQKQAAPATKPTPAQVAGKVQRAAKVGARYRKHNLRTARRHLTRAANPKVRKAIRAVADRRQHPVARLRALHDAAGAPLSEATVELGRGLLALVPDGAFGATAAQTRIIADANGWGGRLPDGFEASAEALDRFAAAAETPAFEAQVDSALEIVRTADRVAVEHVTALRDKLTPRQAAVVERVVRRHAVGALKDLVTVGDAAIAPAANQAFGRLIEDVAALTRLDGKAGDQHLAGRLSKVTRSARAAATAGADAIDSPERLLVRLDGERVVELLDGRRAALASDLAEIDGLAPETRAAIAQVLGDLAPTGRLGRGLGRIVRAAQKHATDAGLTSEEIDGQLRRLASVVKQLDDSRLAKAEGHLANVRQPAVGRALRSFGEPTLATAERRELLGRAAGAPLRESTVALTRGLLALVPMGKLAEVGARARIDDRAVKGQWWGKIVPKDFTATGRALESFAAAADSPEFERQVDLALDIVRVAGRIEADNIAAIGVNVPPAQRAELTRVLQRHAVGVVRDLLIGANGALDPESREVLGALIDDVDALSRLAIDGDGGPRRDAELAAGLNRVTRNAARAGRLADETLKDPAKVLAKLDGKRIGTLLAARRRALEHDVEPLVAASPEARQAVASLASDIELSGKFVYGFARIAGAAANADMPAAERAHVVKEAAESMGPVFIKMIQTVVNQTGGLGSLIGSSSAASDPVVTLALQELQDRVTPMSDAELRTQIRRSLGKDLEDAFVEFDPTPFRSASIGQVHKAKMWVKQGLRGRRLVEVAVKVQRPNLEQKLDETVRASRLAMGVVREGLRIYGPKLLDKPGQGHGAVSLESIEKGLDLVDRTLADFIKSFAIETDFAHERKQMKQFARAVGGESDIYVPEVYDDHSGDAVITMQFVKADSLSDTISRYGLAQRTQRQPIKTGRLPSVDSLAAREAETRVKDHAAATYGLEATSLRAIRDGDGFHVTARFANAAQPRARFAIGDDGAITNLDPTPDLSPAAAGELRDRMVASFINSILVNRFVHGDIHKGNFRILSDGKTIVLFDFGQTVKLEGRHFVAPVQFTLGMLRGNKKLMAHAIVGMSEQVERMSRAERRTAEAAVLGALDDGPAAKGKASPEDLVGMVTLATARAQLTVSPVYLQLVKTSFSMVGNVKELEAIAGPLDLKTLKRAGKRTAGQAALKAVPGANLVKQSRKRQRVQTILDRAED